MNKTDKAFVMLATATAAALAAAALARRQRVEAKRSAEYLERAKQQLHRPVAGGWIYNQPRAEHGQRVYHGGVITKSPRGLF